MLEDLVVLMSRKPGVAWSMSTPTACLLLSQFVPAPARLFAEYRRLRDALPPDTASKFAEVEKKSIHKDMMTMARVHAIQEC